MEQALETMDAVSSRREMESLGSRWLCVVKSTSSGGWEELEGKPISAGDKERMRINLRFSPEVEISGIGRGIHRPYKVKLQDGFKQGVLDCRLGVFKTVHCQYETKRYCKSMDLRITGPERELLAYDLDQVLKFDLVPPTVGRELDRIGFGSIQAWVASPSGWEWVQKGYDFRQHPKNPWLHRLAAFDFITGNIDRHSGNWMLDAGHRVYAIDNGYSFVKGDDREFLRSSAGKMLVGFPIHPVVMHEIAGISEQQVARVLQGRGFTEGEEDGVLKRIRELKTLDRWRKLGALWE